MMFLMIVGGIVILYSFLQMFYTFSVVCLRDVMGLIDVIIIREFRGAFEIIQTTPFVFRGMLFK